jgi:hypothetical protein
LKSLLSYSGCMGSGIVMMKRYLGFFYELHPKASTELHSMMQISHVHHTYENGLTVLPENPGTWQA